MLFARSYTITMSSFYPLLATFSQPHTSIIFRQRNIQCCQTNRNIQYHICPCCPSLARGLVNFVPAVAHHSCLNLPETFSQPRASIIFRPIISYVVRLTAPCCIIFAHIAPFSLSVWPWFTVAWFPLLAKRIDLLRASKQATSLLLLLPTPRTCDKWR